MARDNQNVYSPIYFTPKGKYTNTFGYGECMLFPSKENRDWAKFKVPNKHKYFEPFQKVLCAIGIWVADLYSHYDENARQHYLVSGYMVDDDEVIPYEGNEDLLGKVVEK